MATEEEEGHVSLSNSRSAEKPTKVYAVWGGITAAVVLALGGVGIYPAASNAISTLGKIEAAKADNVTTAAQVTELKKKQDGLEAAQANVQKFISKFPPGADQKQLIDDLTNYAASSGVTITSITATAPQIIGANGAVQPVAAPPPAQPGAQQGPITPTAPSAEFPLAQVTLSLAINGSFDQSTSFIKSMENGSRSFVIDTMTVSPDTAGSGSLTITARSFIARKLTDPKAKPADPANPASPAPAPTASPQTNQ